MLTAVWNTVAKWDLSCWKDFATIVGVIVALITLVKGVWEYILAGRQKRAEQFLAMSKRLYDETWFKDMCLMVAEDNSKLATLSFREKQDFLGRFEEVALLMNSGLIRREVAHYFFGYYTILCWKSDNFWKGVNRDSSYWAVFKDFALQMMEVESKFSFSPRRKFKF